MSTHRSYHRNHTTFRCHIMPELIYTVRIFEGQIFGDWAVVFLCIVENLGY